MESRPQDFMVQGGILDTDLWAAWRGQTVPILDDLAKPEAAQRRVPKWLGASIAGSICGLSGGPPPSYRSYTTPTQQWLIMSGRKPAASENANMQRGHRQEPLIATEYEAVTGVKTRVTGGWEKGGWMGVSPDRLIELPQLKEKRVRTAKHPAKKQKKKLKKTRVSDVAATPITPFSRNSTTVELAAESGPRSLPEQALPPELAARPEPPEAQLQPTPDPLRVSPCPVLLPPATVSASSTPSGAWELALGDLQNTRTDTPSRQGVLEIKSTDADGPKLEWICQIMYQMHVVNVQVGHLCICNLEKERLLRVYEIAYSPEWWAWMKIRLDYFYQCLLDDTEPRLLRYIKREMMEHQGLKTQCEFGDTYPPLGKLKIACITTKQL